MSNIYPYDAQGHRLTGVRLYDEQGRQLGSPDDTYGDSSLPVGVPDQYGSTYWNVYPRPAYGGGLPWQVSSPGASDSGSLGGEPSWTPPEQLAPLVLPSGATTAPAAPTASASPTSGSGATTAPAAPTAPSTPATPTSAATPKATAKATAKR